MIHLVSSIVSAVFRDDELKLLFVGCDGAGKTTLLERLKKSYGAASSGKGRGKGAAAATLPHFDLPTERTIATAGCSSSSTCIGRETDGRAATANKSGNLPKTKPTIGLNVGRVSIKGRRCVLWDLGGQSALRQLWRTYFHQCHAIVFVVDSADPSKFRDAADVLRSLFLLPSLKHVPILIVANKCDVEGARDAAVMQEELRLLDLALMERAYDDEDAGCSCAAAGVANGAAPCQSSTVGGRPRAVAERGRLSHLHQQSPPPRQCDVIPEGVQFCSGIGSHVFRLARVSALRDDGVADAFEWLIDFLSANPRHVEEI